MGVRTHCVHWSKKPLNRFHAVSPEDVRLCSAEKLLLSRCWNLNHASPILVFWSWNLVEIWQCARKRGRLASWAREMSRAPWPRNAIGEYFSNFRLKGEVLLGSYFSLLFVAKRNWRFQTVVILTQRCAKLCLYRSFRDWDFCKSLDAVQVRSSFCFRGFLKAFSEITKNLCCEWPLANVTAVVSLQSLCQL